MPAARLSCSLLTKTRSSVLPVSGEVYDAAANGDLKPERIHDGTLMIMFETSMMLTVTDYAMNTDKRHGMSLLPNMTDLTC